MLDQRDDRKVVNESEWCVGEPPLRWDVSFGARLAEKVKQLFGRGGGDRALPVATQLPAMKGTTGGELLDRV